MDTMQRYNEGLQAASQLAKESAFQSRHGSVTVEQRSGDTVIVFHLVSARSELAASLPKVFHGFTVVVEQHHSGVPLIPENRVFH